MVSPFHARVKRVFYEASRRPSVERAAFLEAACRGEEGVRAEVESLLAFHRSSRAEPNGGHSGSQRFGAGQVVGGRYRIVALLGRGGMGEVYRAWDLALDMSVALKVLVVASPLARAELVREVRLAREVTHPAVCRVYDIAEEDGETFITMEWINGERLDLLLQRQGCFAPEWAIDVMCQLCEGLAAAHEKGIVHRDLKPGNVVIDREGRAHVMDFGTAVFLGRPTVRDVLPIGTPRYMAPEQLREGGEITVRTDVYALGLLLHELLTGIHPQPRRRPALFALRAGAIEPWLVEVVGRALAPASGERFASAAEMGHALARNGELAQRVRRLPRDRPVLCPEPLSGGTRGRLEEAPAPV